MLGMDWDDNNNNPRRFDNRIRNYSLICIFIHLYHLLFRLGNLWNNSLVPNANSSNSSKQLQFTSLRNNNEDSEWFGNTSSFGNLAYKSRDDDIGKNSKFSRVYNSATKNQNQSPQNGIVYTNSSLSNNVTKYINIVEYQSTRHARRLYICGFPKECKDPELLANFFDEVITTGLGDQHGTQHVLNAFICGDKEYGFLEVSSIEIAAATLGLDGILFQNRILTVSRADEYEPEKIQPLLSSLPVLTLNLPASYFAAPGSRRTKTSKPAYQPMSSRGNSFSGMPSGPPGLSLVSNDSMSSSTKTPVSISTSLQKLCIEDQPHVAKQLQTGFMELEGLGIEKEIALDSVPKYDKGSIVVIGFPYDQGAATICRKTGQARGPAAVRNFLFHRDFGSLVNPESDIDISSIPLADAGNVPKNLSLNEAHQVLASVVSKVLSYGAIPIVIGGSSDQSYYSVLGLISVIGGNIGVAVVNSALSVKGLGSDIDKTMCAETTVLNLLEDAKFSPPINGIGSMNNCEGRLVVFGCQGTSCTRAQVEYVQERGGSVRWLNKDIRQSCDLFSNTANIAATTSSFIDTLKALGNNSLTGRSRSVCVSLNLQSICSKDFPGASAPNTVGFHVEEILSVAHACGTDPNVCMLDLSEFNPDVEELVSANVIGQIIYNFILGVTKR